MISIIFVGLLDHFRLQGCVVNEEKRKITSWTGIHHFFDVCAGSLVGFCCTMLLHYFLGGFSECGWLTTLVSALIGAGLNEFTAS